jgi:pimeloyl-ACP methyl ester carboxylesterase
MTNEITNCLKFANLQMAAEALYTPRTAVPGEVFIGSLGGANLSFLTTGNERSSKFTATQATDFAANWTVVEHKSNTSTGFSGTLFKYTGETDAAKGLIKDELVMSFRSTEFADDSARDNQATNSMEINTLGWAFGQIADMQNWYAELKATGNVPATQKIAVTGYSLGGHLAAAFNLLHPGDVSATYTFNAAGVGDVKPGTNLATIISSFNARRGVGGNAEQFTTAEGRARYVSLSTLFSPGASVQASTLLSAVQELTTRLEQPIVLQKTRDELSSLRDALRRSLVIANEVNRISNLTNTGAAPVNISTDAIEAISLDYQLAVLTASKDTYAINSGLAAGVSGVTGARDHRNGVLNNYYDLFGAPLPSAVSNSQIHYGQDTPIWIEDQPLLRGDVLGGVATASSIVNGTKLLVNNFSQNDFGDTLSLGWTGTQRLKYYQFSSCLRPCLLVKTPIRYPKTTKKASPDVPASCKRRRNGNRDTPNSIAACARKQGVRGRFVSEKQACKHLKTPKTNPKRLQITKARALNNSGANNHA